MFAEMPLDNDTVDQCPAVAAQVGRLWPVRNASGTSLADGTI
jgi:hypothetical protein